MMKCYQHTADGLALTGVLDDFTSLSFTRSYNDVGAFGAVFGGDTPNAKRAREADYIAVSDCAAGRIMSGAEVTGQNASLSITGEELKGIVKKRIVIPPTGSSHLELSGTPAHVMREILITQLVDPEDGDRKIPDCRVDDALPEDDRTMKYAGRFSGVYEDLVEIATAYDIGWYAAIEPKEDDPQHADIVFHLFRGADRTADQSENSRLLLSLTNDTLSTCSYAWSGEVPNTAITAGQGEGVDRTVVIVGENAGIHRHEVYIDARDLAEADDLPARAAEKLAEYGSTETCTLTASEFLVSKYRKAYDLGDIATLYNGLNIRFSEITEVYESNALRLDMGLGYDRQTLAHLLYRTGASSNNLLHT